MPLCRLDSDLADELEEILYLQAGLRKSRTTNQIVIEVLWLRDLLLQSCEGEGSSVDYKKMDFEFSTLKTFEGLPTPVFQGVASDGAAMGMPPVSGFDFPPVGARPPKFQGQPPFARQVYGGPPGGWYGGGLGSDVYGEPGHYGSR